MRLATARGKGRNPGTAARGRCCILCLVLAQDRPTITGFDQDAWSARHGGAFPGVGSAIQQIAILRGTNLLGAKLYAGHDPVHLGEVARIRRLIGG